VVGESSSGVCIIPDYDSFSEYVGDADQRVVHYVEETDKFRDNAMWPGVLYYRRF